MSPVLVEVITYTPTVFYHCQHCELTFQHMGVGDRIHREQAREALPEELQTEFAAVSDWIHEIHHRYGGRLRLRLIDAASIPGFWKSWLYRIRKYPAVVVGGRHVHIGTDLEAVEPVIELAVRGREEKERRELP